ncbi:hypothetical protein [Variovorax gossypii]
MRNALSALAAAPAPGMDAPSDVPADAMLPVPLRTNDPVAAAPLPMDPTARDAPLAAAAASRPLVMALPAAVRPGNNPSANAGIDEKIFPKPSASNAMAIAWPESVAPVSAFMAGPIPVATSVTTMTVMA